MGEVVLINAQMWVAQAQPQLASLAAAARGSELAEVWVSANAPTVPMQEGAG